VYLEKSFLIDSFQCIVVVLFQQRTINSLVDFFRPPKDVHLEQLTSATLMKLEEFREKTSTGKYCILFSFDTDIY